MARHGGDNNDGMIVVEAATMVCNCGDIRYKVLWIGEIVRLKGIVETKVLRNLDFVWLQ